MSAQSDFFPPPIVKYRPAQSGIDNAGIGETAHGERYLLKTSPEVALAEYVGASVCITSGIPCGSPSVVEFRGIAVFGSKIESGVSMHPGVLELLRMVKACANPTVFSAVLAVDLATGNPDRHWHNWLYQPQPSNNGGVLVRAIDFSRAWPTRCPPLEFAAFKGDNTHRCWQQWGTYGVAFDAAAAKSTCDSLKRLDGEWLKNLFEQLPVDWMVSADGPGLCSWWSQNWPSRVSAAESFLQSGAWK